MRICECLCYTMVQKNDVYRSSQVTWSPKLANKASLVVFLFFERNKASYLATKDNNFIWENQRAVKAVCCFLPIFLLGFFSDYLGALGLAARMLAWLVSRLRSASANELGYSCLGINTFARILGGPRPGLAPEELRQCSYQWWHLQFEERVFPK
jgi:hypothetical protein